MPCKICTGSAYLYETAPDGKLTFGQQTHQIISIQNPHLQCEKKLLRGRAYQPCWVASRPCTRSEIQVVLKWSEIAHSSFAVHVVVTKWRKHTRSSGQQMYWSDDLSFYLSSQQNAYHLTLKFQVNDMHHDTILGILPEKGLLSVTKQNQCIRNSSDVLKSNCT